jgi:hypothetical protein
MEPEASHIHRIAVLRLALTGAITAALVFFLCWLGTFIPFSSPTHAYIGIFTPADPNSVGALAQGVCWSFLFGGLSGAVLAAVYNALAPLERTL